jgi:hypothetical protein
VAKFQPNFILYSGLPPLTPLWARKAINFFYEAPRPVQLVAEVEDTLLEWGVFDTDNNLCRRDLWCALMIDVLQDVVFQPFYSASVVSRN